MRCTFTIVTSLLVAAVKTTAHRLYERGLQDTLYARSDALEVRAAYEDAHESLLEARDAYAEAYDGFISARDLHEEHAALVACGQKPTNIEQPGGPAKGREYKCSRCLKTTVSKPDLNGQNHSGCKKGGVWGISI